KRNKNSAVHSMLYPKKKRKKSGCYVATCVYGTYDCPQLWVLRRFRDDILERSWFGRRFITLYYAISPTLVKLFGGRKTITAHWRRMLDPLVERLKEKGIQDTPYND
ncbi:MAG: hypothetical protein II832_04905, partial [Synergistaceae bacterium]|nr:hypothetical protein [Synergistaceae bacterium]